LTGAFLIAKLEEKRLMIHVSRTLTIASGIVVAALLAGALFAFANTAKTPSVDDVVDNVLAQRKADVEGEGVSFGEADEINVLVIGLDARKDWDHPHCDAIHLFTLNVETWDIHITSVPRGTYAYIPGSWLPSDYYVSNSCGIMGLEYGIAQMEKILGVKTDYYLTVNFNQVLGIVRLFDLPTTETLQWLRHRQGYAIGDPQRSHNQAVFMKDMIVGHLDRFRSDFAGPMTYVLYNLVDTDLDYALAKALLEGFLEAEIDARPNDITLSMRPHYDVVDYHFDTENPDQQLEQYYSYLRKVLPDDVFTDRSLEEIQAEIVAYLSERIASDESIEDVYQMQLWLQIEDDQTREELHYRILEQYAYEVAKQDIDRALAIVSDYILEKEALQQEDWEKQGRGLLDYLAHTADL
jgi:hypothetical protein